MPGLSGQAPAPAHGYPAPAAIPVSSSRLLRKLARVRRQYLEARNRAFWHPTAEARRRRDELRDLLDRLAQIERETFPVPDVTPRPLEVAR